MTAQLPHCDDLVVHAPGECLVCDKYPDLQAQRQRDGVNFTGHEDPDLAPCPSTLRRSLDKIEAWPHNRRVEEA